MAEAELWCSDWATASGSRASDTTGRAPRLRTKSCFDGVLVIQTTSWPRARVAGTSALPRTPVAAVPNFTPVSDRATAQLALAAGTAARRSDPRRERSTTSPRCRIHRQSEVSNVRKVVAYELLSLDGVAERPDGFFADWDEAMGANLNAVIGAQDSVILGRRSYEEWAEFWPGSELEPFATFINRVAKYVATSTPLDRSWANTSVVEGDLVEFVRDLRNQPGADIGVHASISVAQALLTAGVVDELRLVIAPTIVGRGRRLLDALPAMRFEPIRSTMSPAGYLLIDYRVIL